MRSVERKAQPTAAKLYLDDRIGGGHLVLGAGVHQQERDPSPPGKGFEVAAGVGDAVHFVVGVGEKSDPQTLAAHKVASIATSAGRSCSDKSASSIGRRRTLASTRCTAGFSNTPMAENIRLRNAGGPFQ